MSSDAAEISRLLLERTGYSSVPLASGRADSGRADSGRADSGRSHSGRADSSRAGSGTSGPPPSAFATANEPQAKARTVDFSSVDHLRLAADARVRAAAKAAIDRWGTSAHACSPLREELESTLAATHGVGAAALATDVFAAALPAGDLVVRDESTRWTGRGASFRHNDPESLDAVLRSLRSRISTVTVLIEGHYAGRGDLAPLPDLIDVARRYDCSILVDETHSFGVLGASGRGIREVHGLAGDAVDLWIGALSTSLASTGGYVSGRADLVETVRTAAHGADGHSPASIAAAAAALQIIEDEPTRLDRLRANCASALASARSYGLSIGSAEGTPILPIHVGDARHTAECVDRLRDCGIAIDLVAGPDFDGPSLRMMLSSEHGCDRIADALSVIAESAGEFASRPSLT